jgi:putative transposase
MMNDTLKLTDDQVLTHARDLLQEHLPLAADGRCCTTDDLLNVLLGIAVNRSTLEAVCTDWTAASDPETVRRYLNEQLCVEDLPELEQRLNAALRAEIPRRVWRQARDVAIDFHDRPYYGKQPQDEGLWVRGKARDGTTRFYRIATAYVMLNGLRVTLALRFVLPEMTVVSLLEDVLKSLKKQGFQIACLFLDKGFASIAVMEYLARRQQPALIACPIRGKTGGTRTLCRGHKSYRTTHTFVSGDQTFTAQMAVCRSFTTAKRTKRLKHRAVWLLYILIELDLSPRQARRGYRKRFGIESSYRCAGQVRGWTTSSNPAYRFVLITLSFVLLNVWVHLRWLYAQVPRRGRRWLKVKLLELGRLAKFMRRALERRYGGIAAIQAVATPRL